MAVNKRFLEKRGRPMLIGIGQCRFIRRFADSQVHQFAKAAGETIADLTQRIGVRQLAKQHEDQLRPAGEQGNPHLKGGGSIPSVASMRSGQQARPDTSGKKYD